MTVHAFWRVSCRGEDTSKEEKGNSREMWFHRSQEKKMSRKEGVGSSVEDRKISRKVLGDLDEQMFMGGSFANPFRVSLGENAE